MRKLTIVVAFGLLLAGAARAGPAGGPAFSSGDLHRIGSPKPPKSAGVCKPTNPFLGKADLTLADLPDSYQSQKDFVNALKRAGFRHGYNKVWSCDPAGDVVVFLYLVRNSRGAGAVVSSMSRQCNADRLSGTGLGPRAFGCLLSQSSDQQAIYAWPRENLILLAETLCEGCTVKIAPVARAYAGLLDAATRR